MLAGNSLIHKTQELIMKTYQLIAACLFFLFCFAPFVFSQDIYTSTPDSLGLVAGGLRSDGLRAQACADSFTGQTVSTTLSAPGCTTLSVQNVTVTGTGNLSLTAPEHIEITGPFEVMAGGRFSVDIADPPQKTKVRIFSYDDSGNRISRESN
jgi:hypothetical protein